MQCSKCMTLNKIDSSYCKNCKADLHENSDKESCPKCNTPLLFSDRPCPYCNNQNINNKSFCTGCNKELKNNLFFINSKKFTDAEKIILGMNDSIIFCENCFAVKKDEALKRLNSFKINLNKTLNDMPVVSMENPANLSIIKYFRVVTSQISVRYDNFQNARNANTFLEDKFSDAEERCINSLKKKALSLGANAVVGFDIEYAELNNPERTFLIAMMGTAVIVEEFNILSDSEQKVFNIINTVSK